MRIRRLGHWVLTRKTNILLKTAYLAGDTNEIDETHFKNKLNIVMNFKLDWLSHIFQFFNTYY